MSGLVGIDLISVHMYLLEFICYHINLLAFLGESGFAIISLLFTSLYSLVLIHYYLGSLALLIVSRFVGIYLPMQTLSYFSVG